MIHTDLYHLTGDQEKEFTLRQEASATATQIQSGGLGLGLESFLCNRDMQDSEQWVVL